MYVSRDFEFLLFKLYREKKLYSYQNKFEKDYFTIPITTNKKCNFKSCV